MDQPLFLRNNLLKSQWFGKRKTSLWAKPRWAEPGAACVLALTRGLPAGVSREVRGAELSIPTAPKDLPGHRAQPFAGSSLTVKEMPSARDEAWRAMRRLHNSGSAYSAIAALSYFRESTWSSNPAAPAQAGLPPHFRESLSCVRVKLQVELKTVSAFKPNKSDAAERRRLLLFHYILLSVWKKKTWLSKPSLAK